VLLISTDPAHNLSDAFNQRFSSEPTKVNGFDNLYAMEIDPKLEINAGSMFEEAKGAISEIASSLPGIDEAINFGELIKHVNSMSYSCIVFDTAPTGHTLRLLSFPTVLTKALDMVDSLKSKFAGIVSKVTGSNDMEDQLFGKLQQLRTTVALVNEQFKNPELTTFVCVCIPEFLSLFETERLVQELAKFEIDTHNIVVNQVLMPEPGSTVRSPYTHCRVYTSSIY